jgi:hypothetical protein
MIAHEMQAIRDTDRANMLADYLFLKFSKFYNVLHGQRGAVYEGQINKHEKIMMTHGIVDSTMFRSVVMQDSTSAVHSVT